MYRPEDKNSLTTLSPATGHGSGNDGITSGRLWFPRSRHFLLVGMWLRFDWMMVWYDDDLELPWLGWDGDLIPRRLGLDGDVDWATSTSNERSRRRMDDSLTSLWMDDDFRRAIPAPFASFLFPLAFPPLRPFSMCIRYDRWDSVLWFRPVWLLRSVCVDGPTLGTPRETDDWTYLTSSPLTVDG
ncbi:hypothetical protein CC2G_008238 [Coprinopsis cinerea AmutBmut pab1-1]|nr:hypothetical protein CC2G_008238 [Coprinopsis cinerea AmutBmut pab1-1]